MRKMATSMEHEARLKMQGPDYVPLDKETAMRYIEEVEMKKGKMLTPIVVAQKMG